VVKSSDGSDDTPHAPLSPDETGATRNTWPSEKPGAGLRTHHSPEARVPGLRTHHSLEARVPGLRTHHSPEARVPGLRTHHSLEARVIRTAYSPLARSPCHPDCALTTRQKLVSGRPTPRQAAVASERDGAPPITRCRRARPGPARQHSCRRCCAEASVSHHRRFGLGPRPPPRTPTPSRATRPERKQRGMRTTVTTPPPPLPGGFPFWTSPSLDPTHTRYSQKGKPRRLRAASPGPGRARPKSQGYVGRIVGEGCGAQRPQSALPPVRNAVAD